MILQKLKYSFFEELEILYKVVMLWKNVGNFLLSSPITDKAHP